MPGSCLYQGVISVRIGFQRGSCEPRTSYSDEIRPFHKCLTPTLSSILFNDNILWHPKYSLSAIKPTAWKMEALFSKRSRDQCINQYMLCHQPYRATTDALPLIPNTMTLSPLSTEISSSEGINTGRLNSTSINCIPSPLISNFASPFAKT
jgi:hypothetical protein